MEELRKLEARNSWSQACALCGEWQKFDCDSDCSLHLALYSSSIVSFSQYVNHAGDPAMSSPKKATRYPTHSPAIISKDLIYSVPIACNISLVALKLLLSP